MQEDNETTELYQDVIISIQSAAMGVRFKSERDDADFA
jgi:hypothetical protein